MSSLKDLAQQTDSGLIPLSTMETLFVQYIREFPADQQLKIFDLLSRLSMAKRYTGEIFFSFQWLLEAEKGYDPMIDSETDVLKGVSFS